ncbi:MAG TPA: 16S rRNA (cytosine(1402)-N(4))-methyltransferase RsmH [Erysipelotrichaceae bacterium]|nr:16S rRNA (cytosine(1402)-N(4))-methyltransferase RsmH [Erysipelotrichaceae bacterium]
MNEHIPVLLAEVIEGLNINPEGIYVDLTVGRGGHSAEILKRLTSGRLIAVDQDEEAIIASRRKLEKISSSFVLKLSNFSKIDEILQEENAPLVDGILMDLGVSSPQFDQKERGFSYKQDALLDMRMDQSQELTAYQIINNYSLEELTDIFKKYGEEKYSYSIAKNLVKERETKPIKTTLELVEIIKKSKPMKELKKAGHPAKQVFQALRIAVNDELNVLQITLSRALNHLKPGGRLAVITFHSGEDRLVKTAFKEAAITIGDRFDGPMKAKEKPYYLINRKPISPSQEELKNNPRSASAKLRIIAKKKGEKQLWS